MASRQCSFAIFLAYLLAGCATNDSAPRAQLMAEDTRDVYDVSLERCRAAPPKVQHFVASTAQGRPESLRAWIEGPPGACTTAIARAVVKAGVDPSHVSLSSTTSLAHGARIQLERRRVSHALCYLSDGFNRGVFTENVADPALGCSTAAAIGGMVADPEDLAVGKGRSRAEGEPATQAVANLRGEQRTPVEPHQQDRAQLVARPAP